MRHASRSRRPIPGLPTVAEICEPRTLLTTLGAGFEVAAINGVGNNVNSPDWGSTDEELLRLTWANYNDGLSTPAGQDRLSAREISNAIASVDEAKPNSRHLSDVAWLWGQFIDHDLDITEGANPAEPFNIAVPSGDPFFDPQGTGTAEIELNRSVYVVDSQGVRQQINQITAFLDGSGIYGSDDIRAAALRTFVGGQLKTSANDLLPFNTPGLPNAGGESETLFLAGDVRANENVALSAMHTLWVREHNRLADEISAMDSSLTDEEIYQQARTIVRAKLQVITYNEFLPALLGSHALSPYEGYDPSVNAGISTEFSTAAYRFGHSMLSSELTRLDANGNVIPQGNLPLKEAFFNPSELQQQGVDSILRGLSSNVAQEIDNQIVDDVRNFLFGPPGAGGFDLASLNIQRGRDHALPSYNDVRDALGLGRVSDFWEITSDPDVAAKLRMICEDVDGLDLWVAGLAEDHLPGSSMGETFTSILVDQFERLRDGDRFWYQNLFEEADLAELEETTLASVIERNSGIRGLQANVFFAQEYPNTGHTDSEITVIATGPGREGLVQVLDTATLQEQLTPLTPYPSFAGGVRVATGDVNNDGIPDIVTAPGPGGGPHVRVFDGRDGSPISSFFGFDPNFAGGVHIAVADISGPHGHPDGFADIVVSADAGGGPHVRVISGQSVLESSQPDELSSFFPYNPLFTGGVRVAAGDISGDGTPDIITSPGPGGGAHVRIFDGTTLQSVATIPGALGDFMAYHPSFTGGAFVATGDIDGDGQIDVITSPGSGGGPHVKIFGGAQEQSIAEFFAYSPSFLGGVHVAASDANGDGRADVITTPGQGGGPHVRIFDIDTSGALPQISELNSFVATDPQFTGGLWVAGSTRQTSVAPMSLNLATGFAPDGNTANLTMEDLQPIVSAAIQRLDHAGLPKGASELLSSVNFEIADLNGNRLGEALPGRVRIDINAAGMGWYVDTTPNDDMEFSDNTLSAVDPAATGRIDLLTVILHELIHELGGEDLNSMDHAEHLMADTLGPSQRRLPQFGDLDHLFANEDLLGRILE